MRRAVLLLGKSFADLFESVLHLFLFSSVS